MVLLGLGGGEFSVIHTGGEVPAPKQIFAAEFKHVAVWLVQSTGRSCAQIASDLSISLHFHYVIRWKKKQGSQATLCPPVLTGCGLAALYAKEVRTKELEWGLEIARQERDVLKKRWLSLSNNPGLRLH